MNRLLILLAILLPTCLFAQTSTIKGKLLDTISIQPVAGATITVLSRSDSSLISFTMTNAKGEFTLSGIEKGQYRLLVTHVNYHNVNKYFEINESKKDVDLTNIELSDKNKVLEKLQSVIKYPFIAKPVDDGCSSAVKKIKTPQEFEAFAKLIFRTTETLDKMAAQLLNIKEKEEFPQKRVILVEELISKKDAKHFLEITGGMLTKYDENGNISYEVFEASDALSEGEVLSLEEKFLAGQGQNITPARYSTNPTERQKISDKVKQTLGAVAKLLNINGYTRIDAFVRIYNPDKVEVIFIEVNSLPGMTPATCIFHQSAINGYKPYDFIDRILEFGVQKNKKYSVV